MNHDRIKAEYDRIARIQSNNSLPHDHAAITEARRSKADTDDAILQNVEALKLVTDTARTRIAELEAECWRMKEERDRAIGWRDSDQARAEAAEAKLAKAMDGLRECEGEIDQYIRQEYPHDHPVQERYRQRDFAANPARATLAALKGTDQ